MFTSKLFHVYNRSDDACEAKVEWRASSVGQSICAGCFRPYETVKSLDVDLVHLPARPEVNYVSGTGLGIISSRLLEALAPLSTGALGLGEVSLEGAAITTFKSFVPLKIWTIRGQRGSVHRRCDACGRLIYHPVGSRYLIENQIDNSLLACSQFSQLIVQRELTEVFDRQRLAIDATPVKKKALDDLSVV